MTRAMIFAFLDLSSIGNKAGSGGVPGAGKAPGDLLQTIESMMEFFVANLVRLAFSLSGRRLSARIYKICTLLSTSFVENIAEANRATPRKALSGAVFRAMACAHWQCGR